MTAPKIYCYEPELSNEKYLKEDLLVICEAFTLSNNLGMEPTLILEMMMNTITWEHPSTWLDQELLHGEIK